jgi:hypothetical protein
MVSLTRRGDDFVRFDVDRGNDERRKRQRRRKRIYDDASSRF